MKKIPKTVTIYEDIWNTTFNTTALLNGNGMCCLGFLALRQGAAPADIKDRGYPPSQEVRTYSMDFIYEAVRINDTIHNTPQEKKAKLRAHFAQAGTRLIFKSKAPASLRAKVGL